jgi:serine/threonine protein kinase
VTGATNPRAVEPVEAEVPKQIGPFEVGEVIGRGGFGVIVKAERHEPYFDRVAIKVCHATLPAPVRDRLRSEMQALALVRHPSVASIFDAGSLPDGRLYIVMELIRGYPIDTWCDRFDASIGLRLQLVRQLLDALRAVHAVGIVHCDVTARNVLVSGSPASPSAKLIDFGLARSIAMPLQGTSTADEVIRGAGTPGFASRPWRRPEDPERAP